MCVVYRFIAGETFRHFSTHVRAPVMGPVTSLGILHKILRNAALYVVTIILAFQVTLPPPSNLRSINEAIHIQWEQTHIKSSTISGKFQTFEFFVIVYIVKFPLLLRPISTLCTLAINSTLHSVQNTTEYDRKTLETCF